LVKIDPIFVMNLILDILFFTPLESAKAVPYYVMKEE